jgi:hypothetical protein
LATPFERARSTRRLLVGGRLLLSLWAIGLSPADITDVVCPKHTGLSSLGFALLVASFAIGGVAGAMATPRLSARFGTSRVLRLTAALTAGTAVAAGAASSGPTAGACIAAYGAANLARNVTASAAESHSALFLAGLEADSFGLRAPFYVEGALLIAAILVSMRPASHDTPTPCGSTGSRVNTARRRTTTSSADAGR